MMDAQVHVLLNQMGIVLAKDLIPVLYAEMAKKLQLKNVMTEISIRVTGVERTVRLLQDGIALQYLDLLHNVHSALIRTKKLQMNNVTMGTLQEETGVRLLVKLKRILTVMGPLMDVLCVETDRFMFLSNVTMEIQLITMDAQVPVNMRPIHFVLDKGQDHVQFVEIQLKMGLKLAMTVI